MHPVYLFIALRSAHVISYKKTLSRWADLPVVDVADDAVVNK